MKKIALILSMALSMSLLTACGSSDTTTSSTSTGTSGTTTNVSTEIGGEIHLNTAITEEFVSPDPNKSNTAVSIVTSRDVNMGLYKHGIDGNVTLEAAESVEISEDGTTYTFTMRDDIFWTNGTPVTAYDYEYSFKRLANPDNGFVYAYMLPTIGIVNGYEVAYEGADLDSLGITAIDEKTLVIEFTKPKSYITELLASQPCFYAVNQEFCEEMGDLFMTDIEHSIFCGPFLISEWEVGGTTYKVSKNPDYHAADLVTCDSISYTLLPDVQQRILAWENGTLDVLAISGDFYPMYAQDSALYPLKSKGIFFITFNTQSDYFSNTNLRLAVSTAINKQPIADNILQDGAVAVDFIIPDSFSADSNGVIYRENAGNPTYNEYDPELALEYWEKAKAELGVDSIEVSFLYNEDTQIAATAAYIQSELQKTLPGLTVKLNVTTYNQRVADMSSGNYEFGITRWYADYQDPSTFLDMWIDGTSLNYGKWYNEEYNDLYQLVIGEYALDDELRIATQAQMEKIFLEDGGACPLYQPAVLNLRNTNFAWNEASNGVSMFKYTNWK